MIELCWKRVEIERQIGSVENDLDEVISDCSFLVVMLWVIFDIGRHHAWNMEYHLRQSIAPGVRICTVYCSVQSVGIELGRFKRHHGPNTSKKLLKS